MLKLDYGLERERKNILLGKLRAQFSKYFDFITSGSLATNLAYSQAVGQNNEQFVPGTATVGQVRQRLSDREDPVISQIFEIFLNADEGVTPALKTSSSPTNNPTSLVGTPIKSLKERLQEKLITQNTQENNQEKIDKIARCVAMHYSLNATNGGTSPEGDNPKILFSDLETVGLQSQEEKDNITAFEITHPLMIPGQKNAELLTVFFNSIPALEMTRATPVMNVKIYSSREVEQNGKLGAITLHKFLEGSITVPTEENNSLRAINLASQVTGSIFGETDRENTKFSVVGLELFTAPQTLQNIQATKNKDNYLAPVIDPMRPLASIKNLEIEVKPTVGLMQTKTAKLEIVLHDRSRLGEFADFVKPDRYGSSFIDIEYGWSHPDGIDLEGNETTTKNPYAQLLNLTRAKEHFGIMSSNFSFDEVGQVNITLNLYTRGSAEAGEISITSPQSPELRAQIKKLEELSKEINRLTSIVFRPRNSNEDQGGNNGGRRTEIRGQQMLTAASDSQNMLILNNELFNSLRDLRANLRGIAGNNHNSSAQREAANALEGKLRELLGNTNDNTRGENAVDNSRRPTPDSAVGNVQATINSSIHDALQNINRSPGNQSVNPLDFDIFLKRMPQAVKNQLRAAGMRQAGTRSEVEGQGQLSAAQLNPSAPQSRRRSRGSTHRTANHPAGTPAPANAPAAAPAAPAAAPPPPAPAPAGLSDQERQQRIAAVRRELNRNAAQNAPPPPVADVRAYDI